LTIPTKPKVVAVIGATATGKTAVGVELAIELGGEVVNGDSRLFYRGMDVATAKPTPAEIRGVPHHLIDFLDPNEKFSLGEYLRKARLSIEEISNRGKFPIVVGGSGQYIWALIEGWEVPEIEPDLQLRAELDAKLKNHGVQSLAEQLQRIAPDIAGSTDLKNPRRVIRAIERASAGESDSKSSQQKAAEEPFESCIVGLSAERTVLHQRVIDRLEMMRKLGWVNEVESLLKSGYSDEGRALSGIGYRQMIGHLSGEYDLEEAIRLTAVATNRLIRQQSNWFKSDDERINWFDMTNDSNRTTKSIIEHVTAWHTS
jgi:tRNA dimethylallyltransferase